MHGEEVDKLFKELRKLDEEEREEELLLIKNLLFKKYKKNLKIEIFANFHPSTKARERQNLTVLTRVINNE